MRHGIALVAYPCIACLVFAVRMARATDCSGLDSPCIDDDILWPHSGYARFEAVGATQILAPRQLGFGLVPTYLSRPVVLPLRTNDAAVDRDAVDNQVDGTFLWAYAVARRLELDLALPVTFGQSGSGLSAVTGGDSLGDTAVRDLRFGFTYAIVPHAPLKTSHAEPGLAGRLEISAPTGDRSQFAGERSGVLAPSVAADFGDGPWFIGGEVGARLRPTTELEGARVGSQLFTSLGMGVDVLRHDLLTRAIEAWALPTLGPQDAARGEGDTVVNRPRGQWLVPSEWQVTVRTAPVALGDVSIQLGGGGSLPLTGDIPLTTPHVRFTIGVRWAPTQSRQTSF